MVAAEFSKVLDACRDRQSRGPVRDHRRRRAPSSRHGRARDPRSCAPTWNPDVAQAQLAKLGSLASNRDLLFERITNFGGTVAGETRNLALIATVASWLIIIVYLWLRFKSLIYGLAAVIAVVHDVLDHPGCGGRQLLARHDSRDQHSAS